MHRNTADDAGIVYEDINRAYFLFNQELVDKGLAAYTEKGIKARGYVCDVTDEPAVQAMVCLLYTSIEREEKEHGYVDYITVSASLLFAMKYVTSLEGMKKDCLLYTSYQQGRHEP